MQVSLRLDSWDMTLYTENKGIVCSISLFALAQLNVIRRDIVFEDKAKMLLLNNE